ncbi:MAG: hypothetical protein K9K86_09030 [Pseudomonadales bacterium]|nr:hypothetical protein [Pseudomonadales bacterium]
MDWLASVLRQAARWRVKDFVDLNGNNAVLDIIRLTEDAFRGCQHMIMWLQQVEPW